VRFFGFSGLGDPAALHQVIDSGEFHSVQAYYNLLNPSAGQAGPGGFRALDLGPLVGRAGPKGHGGAGVRALAPRPRTSHARAGGGGPEPLSPGSDYTRDLARAEKVKFLVGKDVKRLTHAAIRFALMKKGVSTVLVGFSNTAHIDDAAVCSGEGGLPEDAMARLRELWNSDFGDAAA